MFPAKDGTAPSDENQFPRKGTGAVRVLVTPTDSTLWGELGACWSKHIKPNSISKKVGGKAWKTKQKKTPDQETKKRILLGQIPPAGASFAFAGALEGS